ncbi:hypothetical protein CRL705_1655 [Latilactobacillus curvatus CRL 705]|nr:hypothetical protein CRL705_1655 [Latilactobacillus curvatus CRL 705]
MGMILLSLKAIELPKSAPHIHGDDSKATAWSAAPEECSPYTWG